jgi:FixJ family two-component response regulator
MSHEEPTVYVIDDDDAVRRFLTEMLSSVSLNVEEYASAQDFLDDGEAAAPGCLVLDLRMPGMSGLELQKKLAERAIRLPIIFLTGHGDVEVAVHAMKGGAVDFIEKPFNNELLLDRIQAAISRSVHDNRNSADESEIEMRLQKLTPRERQVLELVSTGLTNKGVARELDISERTVEIHRAHVMEKMEAKSLASLVKMASAVGVS